MALDAAPGGLDRVQNVDMAQIGLWQNLLNYGNVDIKTAATDEGYTFPEGQRSAGSSSPSSSRSWIRSASGRRNA